MIYLDNKTILPNLNPKFKNYCHLMTDSSNLEELHNFAKLLKLKREWF
jgi:hypothetical protein